MILRSLRMAALGALAGGSLMAATIDITAVDNPQAIVIADRLADARWQSLFVVDPDWISRQIIYLGDRLPALAPTLFTARLIYTGEPWTRRVGQSGNARKWRNSDIDTRQSILREIRARRDPVYAPVLRHLLTIESNPNLVVSALTTLWLLDPTGVPALAVRLADPQRPDHLPGSASAAVRQNALHLLLGLPGSGIDAGETRQALEYALLQAKSGERNHALGLLVRGQVPALLKAAILRLAGERVKGELDEDGAAGLTLAFTRLSTDIDAELAAALVTLAVEGKREVAAPAATALASNLTWTATVPVDAIAQRAKNDPDLVIRNCLLNLLVRVNAKAGGIAGPGSPWTLLAAHRERMSRWEWEEYVR